MNRQEGDILTRLYIENYTNQRTLAQKSGHSIGVVNKCLKSLEAQGFLDSEFGLTAKAYSEFDKKKPKNAIILAAGYGMRMVPINMETSKAMLEVNGEVVIERLIKQLQEVGVTQIYVVVGFMKEKFEYLIDDYGVELVYNNEYSSKNNLHSLNLAVSNISNTYIVPCDIWCEINPFNKTELYSWYMVNDLIDNRSNVRVNRKMELVTVSSEQAGNSMLGIAYVLEEQSTIIRKRLQEYDKQYKYENSFWEDVLYDGDKMILNARVVHSVDIVEINTYEQLRELDEDSNHLKSDAIDIISKVLKHPQSNIINIQVLKKGMTNRSFTFECDKKRYIMRIPGEGTDLLINRQQEAEVYNTIKDKNISDDIIYINEKNGYKITRYWDNARVCNPDDYNDLRRCMEKLREFHNMNLKVEHQFDIFEKLEFYESLWEGESSVYKDYKTTKENVLSLKSYIEKNVDKKCLTHIDAVADNFLFINNDTEVRLIDWEYSAMQDPHIDIAMFCIYSMYEKNQVDQLIDIYFENECQDNIRIKIYCYIAVCGLLWSNWCEYKRKLGVEFGEYSIRQYRYAKQYYKLVKDKI